MLLKLASVRLKSSEPHLKTMRSCCPSDFYLHKKRLLTLRAYYGRYQWMLERIDGSQLIPGSSSIDSCTSSVGEPLRASEPPIRRQHVGLRGGPTPTYDSAGSIFSPNNSNCKK